VGVATGRLQRRHPAPVVCPQRLEERVVHAVVVLHNLEKVKCSNETVGFRECYPRGHTADP